MLLAIKVKANPHVDKKLMHTVCSVYLKTPLGLTIALNYTNKVDLIATKEKSWLKSCKWDPKCIVSIANLQKMYLIKVPLKLQREKKNTQRII